MKLYEILNITPGVTALIGSGGKTTAMYRLAAELAEVGTVLCCTTTRILSPDHMPVLLSPSVNAVRAALEACSCLCVGELVSEGKLGPGPLPVAALAALADYVLVEADGSRGLPGKAHLPHEPVVPAEANQTVCLVGAAAFGRPVREAVHRWERFCALTGLAPGAPVTPAAVAAVLRAEGLADRVLINQAEQAMDQARALAELLPWPAAAGSLREGEWICLS